MIRECEVRLGLEFLFSGSRKQEEAEDAIDDDNDVSDISDMDTEGISVDRIVGDREPVEEKRDKREHNTYPDYPGTPWEMEEVETQTGSKSMYFIF